MLVETKTNSVPEFLRTRLERVDALQPTIHLAGELDPVTSTKTASCWQALPIHSDAIAQQEAVDSMGLDDLSRQVAEVFADRALHRLLRISPS